ncbi:AaceriABL119Cp [[Ashbya] aceris (nom. inval.)]|nr:AaceriABL119Cp [[Ashbya] aceris (nom. inval.)]
MMVDFSPSRRRMGIQELSLRLQIEAPSIKLFGEMFCRYHLIRQLKQVQTASRTRCAHSVSQSQSALKERLSAIHEKQQLSLLPLEAVKRISENNPAALIDCDTRELLRLFLAALQTDQPKTQLSQLLSQEEGFSVFVHRLLPTYIPSDSLDHLVSKGSTTALLEKLYGFYRERFPDVSSGLRTPARLHDANCFARWFLAESKLRLARTVFAELVGNPMKLHELPRDTETLITLLQLHFGAKHTLWRDPGNSVGRGGQLVAPAHMAVVTSYSSLGEETLLQLLRLLQSHPQWKSVRSPDLDRNIILALAFHNRLDLVRAQAARYFEPAGAEHQLPDTHLVPDGSLVGAIVTAFAFKHQLEQGLAIAYQFMERFAHIPNELELWKIMFAWIARRHPAGPQGAALYDDAWLKMRTRYAARAQAVPYDYSIARSSYRIVRRDSSLRRVRALLNDYMSSLYQQPAVASRDRLLLLKCQAHIVSRLVRARRHRAATRFVDRWALDSDARKQLLAHLAARSAPRALTDDDDASDGLYLTGAPLW